MAIRLGDTAPNFVAETLVGQRRGREEALPERLENGQALSEGAAPAEVTPSSNRIGAG